MGGFPGAQILLFKAPEKPAPPFLQQICLLGGPLWGWARCSLPRQSSPSGVSWQNQGPGGGGHLPEHVAWAGLAGLQSLRKVSEDRGLLIRPPAPAAPSSRPLVPQGCGRAEQGLWGGGSKREGLPAPEVSAAFCTAPGSQLLWGWAGRKGLGPRGRRCEGCKPRGARGRPPAHAQGLASGASAAWTLKRDFAVGGARARAPSLEESPTCVCVCGGASLGKQGTWA